MAADLQAEWAGVLQRWGNSTVETVETVTSGVESQSNSNHYRQSPDYNKYDSHERQSNKYESHERQSTKYESHNRQPDNYSKYESNERQSGPRMSVKQQESSSERQNSRDRQERQTGVGTAGKTGGRQRWSSVSRGSVSPGKENCDSFGYRYNM